MASPKTADLPLPGHTAHIVIGDIGGCEAQRGHCRRANIAVTSQGVHEQAADARDGAVVGVVAVDLVAPAALGESGTCLLTGDGEGLVSEDLEDAVEALDGHVLFVDNGDIVGTRDWLRDDGAGMGGGD